MRAIYLQGYLPLLSCSKVLVDLVFGINEVEVLLPRLYFSLNVVFDKFVEIDFNGPSCANSEAFHFCIYLVIY